MRIATTSQACFAIEYGIFTRFAMGGQQFISPERRRSGLAMCVGGCAGSCAAYSAYTKTLLAYFIPTILPVVVHLFLFGDTLNVVLGAGLCVYSIVTVSSTFTVNKSILSGIRLNFELEAEVEERKKAEEKN